MLAFKLEIIFLPSEWFENFDSGRPFEIILFLVNISLEFEKISFFIFILFSFTFSTNFSDFVSIIKSKSFLKVSKIKP